jgi:hypothetical protein
MLSATEAYQLLKLPYIFQHYSVHRHENKKLTFLQFLDMHYMHGCPKDKDYKEDMKLPFKTHVKYAVTPSIAYFAITNPGSQVKAIELPRLKVILHNENFIPWAYLSTIWQPPKSC